MRPDLLVALTLSCVCAQETDTRFKVETSQKLDGVVYQLSAIDKRLTTAFQGGLASNEQAQALNSRHTEIISLQGQHASSIETKVTETEQTLVARLDSIILEVQSVQLILDAAAEFKITLNQLAAENKTLKG